MSAEMCDFCTHNKIPYFDLAILGAWNKSQGVLFREKFQICNNATMSPRKIMRLEAFHNIKNFDLTVCRTCGQIFTRGVKGQLKGHLSIDFKSLDLGDYKFFSQRKHSYHVVFVWDS